MNKNIILIKYGDLYLKGKNKKVFIQSLITNIKNALFDFKIKIENEHDNAKVIFDDINDKNKIINILKHIPGISFIIPCKIIERDLDKFKNEILDLFNESGTFKINAKRKDKKYDISSLDFNKLIGNWILENKKSYKVDIRNPTYLLNIEINKKNFIYYSERKKGISGLPIGLNGKALVLLSGGIDSPVAAHLLQRKGIKVDYVTFITPPHTSDKSLEKVKDLVDKISFNGRIYKPKLYIINFTNILNELLHIEEEYRIIIMRRIFVKISEKISKKINANFMATGDSLGQVASQTIESMDCITDAVEDTLILRPLITFSKEEIIQVAKKINTYDISILPYEDSCSLFVPKNPITKPKIKKILEIESKLIFMEELINKSIENI